MTNERSPIINKCKLHLIIASSAQMAKHWARKQSISFYGRCVYVYRFDQIRGLSRDRWQVHFVGDYHNSRLYMPDVEADLKLRGIEVLYHD